MNFLLFLILESVSMIIVLICCKNIAIIFSKSVSNFSFVQIVSYCLGKNISRNPLYGNVRLFITIHKVREWSKIGSWCDCCYCCDLNLRTNYLSIVLFHLYTCETHHWRHDIGKVWET